MPRQELPDIDARRCTLCGDCIVVCPADCLSIARDVEVVLAPHACLNCGICEAICPADAIAMRTRDW